VFGNTTRASFAVLASQRLPYHTGNTEVLFIKLPQSQKLIDHFFLLGDAAELWHIPWFVNHSAEIKVSTKTIETSKGDIAKGHGRVGCWSS
jgi:hypothetical protein